MFGFFILGSNHKPVSISLPEFLFLLHSNDQNPNGLRKWLCLDKEWFWAKINRGLVLVLKVEPRKSR